MTSKWNMLEKIHNLWTFNEEKGSTKYKEIMKDFNNNILK